MKVDKATLKKYQDIEIEENKCMEKVYCKRKVCTTENEEFHSLLCRIQLL